VGVSKIKRRVGSDNEWPSASYNLTQVTLATLKTRRYKIAPPSKKKLTEKCVECVSPSNGVYERLDRAIG